MIPSKRKNISKNYGSTRHKLVKENVNVAKIDSQTLETWLRDDVQFRFTSSIDVTGLQNKGNKSNQIDYSSTSSKELNSLKSYSSGADSQFSSSNPIFPLVSEQDTSLISQPEFQPLFEKLILHVHSKRRVEIVRNLLISQENKTLVSNSASENKKKALSHSNHAGLIKRLEDTKLNLSRQTQIKKGNIEKLNSTNSRCSVLEKKRQELLFKIQEAKQKIALKQKHLQNTQEKFLSALDPGYLSEFKNISKSYLFRNQESRALDGIEKSSSPVEKISQILRQIKEATTESFNSKVEANYLDKFPDFTETRNKVRSLITKVPLDQIYRIVSDFSKEASSKLASDFQSSSLQKESFHKQKLMAYEKILSEIFDRIPHSGFNVNDYLQSTRKFLFTKQIELKESLFQLKSTDKAIAAELQAITNRFENLSTDKQNLLSQILLLNAEIYGLENNYEIELKAPVNTSYHLESGLHSSSLNHQLDEDISTKQFRLNNACQGIQVLLRTFQLQNEQEPLKLNFDYPLLIDSLEKLCQKSETSVESELKSFDLLETNYIISMKNLSTQSKLKFNGKSLNIDFLHSASFTVVENYFQHNCLQIQPLTWYKTVDWIYPGIMDVIQIKRSFSKLVSDFEKQAHSHLSQWNKSLLEWNYDIRSLNKEVTADFSFTSQNLHEDLKELFYQVNQLWNRSKSVANSDLDYINDQLIPIIQKQCFEIHSCFEERDDLLKEFPM